MDSKCLQGNMKVLRPAAAFFREGLRPSAHDFFVTADPAFGKHQAHDFHRIINGKCRERSIMAARKSGNAAILKHFIRVCEARENGQKWTAVASLLEFRNDRSRQVCVETFKILRFIEDQDDGPL